MWDKCTKYCRLLVLSLIIIFSAILLHFNKTKINIEKFTNMIDSKTVYVKTINKVYRDALSRNPSDFEVEKIIQMMKNDRDDVTVFEMIKNTEEYRDKNKLDIAIKKTSGTNEYSMINQALESMKLKDRVEIYRSIIDKYEKILDRMPLITELNYYAYRITTDKNFTDQQLETILTLSNEHKILEKNQTNVVNFELRGNLTEAEIKYEVGEIYKNALGTKEEPGYELYQLLKKRYIDYQMDKDKLTKLIILMDMMDKNEISKDIFDIVSKEQNGNADNAGNAGNAGIKERALNILDSSKKDNALYTIDKMKEVDANVEIVTKNNEKMQEELDKALKRDAIKQEIVDTLKQITKKYPDEDFNETLQCINNGGFNIDNGVKKNNTSLANYQSERNVNKIKDSISRDSKYLNADDNMILFPEFKWDVPQKRPPVCYYSNKSPVQPSLDQTALIGTLLEDANNNNTIMPKFQYREIIN